MFRPFALLLAVSTLPTALFAQRSSADTAYAQPLRPQYHFSPRTNWTNDPNGLVYYDGEFHLFFQHNPFGTNWGHMTWGHAISRNLVHWRELPPAIAETGETMIFSGSCVVDKKNSSGFGRDGRVPMVAVYTAHQPNRQTQHIAYSLDKGRTWTKYDANPVLDLNKKDFRDPKVFWHEPTQHWVMVVVLPTEKKALFYNSPNLRNWVKTGEFTATDSPANVWECPDLIEIPVERTVERKWVLLLSMGSNGAGGGSGMQYYVGRFNGRAFVSEQPAGPPRYVDYGRDYYAAVTYNNLPVRGNRGAISIGWMSNLQYAANTPTSPFRGAMTLPRELGLAKVGAGYELRQRPIQELKTLVGPPLFQWTGTDVTQLNQGLTASNLAIDTYRLTLELEPGQAASGVRVRQGKTPKGETEATVVGYDPQKQQTFVDRSRSGQVSFSKDFPGRYVAPLKPQEGRISLQVWVDRSAVEVFANDGQATLTNLIFPDPASQGISFFGGGIRSVTIQPVEGIWK